MTKKDRVLERLDTILHPETGLGLVGSGFVADVSVPSGKVDVELKFRRARDPFAATIRRQVSTALSEVFPSDEVSVRIDSPDAEPASAPSRKLPGVGRIVAVASGKGGVGKSTVAAHLAVTLAAEGYRVGLLDGDIYGPSQPALFGVPDYLPPAEGEGKGATMTPAESMGVKIMSIGFFISPDDALVWRGPMVTGALRQLIRQTAWGELDYLLIDLPPGTGDILLSVTQELELDGAVIVSTPQGLALADVKRGVEMLRADGVGVPVLGVIENMAWFTPAELPKNRYFIFGEGGARRFASEEGIEFLGDIPIVQSVMESGEKGLPSGGIHPEVAPFYLKIARRIVDKLSAVC